MDKFRLHLISNAQNKIDVSPCLLKLLSSMPMAKRVFFNITKRR